MPQVRVVQIYSSQKTQISCRLLKCQSSAHCVVVPLSQTPLKMPTHEGTPLYNIYVKLPKQGRAHLQDWHRIIRLVKVTTTVDERWKSLFSYFSIPKAANIMACIEGLKVNLLRKLLLSSIFCAHVSGGIHFNVPGSGKVIVGVV